MLQSHSLSVITYLPLLGALLLALPLFKGEKAEGLSRLVALLVSGTTFFLSLLLLKPFDLGVSEDQFVEMHNWIPSFGIKYHFGVDGLSIWLVMLTTFLMPLVVLASHSVTKYLRGYLACMLVLETAMLGTLFALDGFLFYVFWEMMLAPMYFIIGIWGGKRKIYATVKFVLYTVAGSVLMLVALFYMAWLHKVQMGQYSFAINDLINTQLLLTEEMWLFAAFALAFGIKVPLFPFHTWLPDAHVEAPTGGSVVLAGVLLKMGIYGFLRLAYPLFPRAAEAYAPYLAALGVIGIVYGALVAWRQDDIKKLVAYSSVSHLGYCVLGLASFNLMSTSGSIYQMLNHGITTGALFLLVGVLYDRKHTREIAAYGGLAGKVPVFAFLFLVFTFSSIALPLTNGFVGEFMILAGSFQTFPALTAIAVLGVVLGAVYMLGLYKRTMFGEFNEEKNGDLTDVSLKEGIVFAPLLILVFVMGIYPQPFLSRMEKTITDYFQLLEMRSDMLDQGVLGTPMVSLKDRLKNPGQEVEVVAKKSAAEII
jgi:NADH-quinone oxidoreductase subunit M